MRLFHTTLIAFSTFSASGASAIWPLVSLSPAKNMAVDILGKLTVSFEHAKTQRRQHLHHHRWNWSGTCGYAQQPWDERINLTPP